MISLIVAIAIVLIITNTIIKHRKAEANDRLFNRTLQILQNPTKSEMMQRVECLVNGEYSN